MRMITQRDFKDCGVTCMEYIIKFYHGYIPIEKLREDTFTSQEGTTAIHIVEAFIFGVLEADDLIFTFFPMLEYSRFSAVSHGVIS